MFDGFALVANSTASDIQGGHPGLQMSSWLRSRLPRRWLRRCFVDCWSSISAFGGASGIDCTEDKNNDFRSACFSCCVDQRSGTRCRARWDRQNFLITVFGRNLKLTVFEKLLVSFGRLWGAVVLIVCLLLNLRINEINKIEFSERLSTIKSKILTVSISVFVEDGQI